ncbi:MAG: response regulator transcription factor [Chloroflexota bacterium]|nr:response regulator transcription factor [Chloroflexota bacterium]
MMRPIRIMIAEDHSLFGHGLRRVLNMESDLEVIAEVGDGNLAVERALELTPDVVLMDINLPKRNGLQATREITSSLDDVSVVVLTAYDDEQQMFYAMRAGASAYFGKDVLPDVLVEAVRTVATGRYVIDGRTLQKHEVMPWLLSRFDELSEESNLDEGSLVPLTRREMEILGYIVEGESNKTIALKLGISQQTVKNHMSSILRKLSASDRTEAAVVALRKGWVPLQETRDEKES